MDLALLKKGEVMVRFPMAWILEECFSFAQWARQGGQKKPLFAMPRLIAQATASRNSHLNRVSHQVCTNNSAPRAHTTKRLMFDVLFFVVFGVSLMPVGSNAVESFPVRDSGAWADTESSIGWVRNDEIAYRGNASIRVGETVAFEPTLSIWKPSKGISHYKRHVKNLCVHDWLVAYVVKEPGGGPPQAYQGPWRAERPVGVRDVRWSTCGLLSSFDVKDRHIDPLLPGHGALDRGPLRGSDALRNDPIELIREDGQRLQLTLKRREISGVRYYAFMRAYLVVGHYFNPQTGVSSTPWPKDLPRPLWWMKPDGSVSTVNVLSPWNQSEAFYPTKAGIVVSGFDKRKPKARDFEDTGLFLIQPDGVAREMIEGYVPRVAVSPDGCAIAFAHVEHPPQRGTSKLKMIRLCE